MEALNKNTGLMPILLICHLYVFELKSEHIAQCKLSLIKQILEEAACHPSLNLFWKQSSYCSFSQNWNNFLA